MKFNKSSSYFVERTLPQNLQNKDFKNFQHELKREFSLPKILIKKMFMFTNKNYGSTSILMLFSNHWRMSNFWIRHKITLFFKNLINALIFRNNISYEVIPKASWVVDQKELEIYALVF